MTLPKFKDLSLIVNVTQADKEIFILQKELLTLRLKKPTNQGIKPHLFRHAKRRIAQLKFKRSMLINLSNLN